MLSNLRLIILCVGLGCESSNTCSVNGVDYTCPSQAALDKCGAGDPSACTNPNTPAEIKISCNGQTCDGKKQYCIDGKSSSICAALPSGCLACGCLPEVKATWRALNNNTNNCDRGSTCSGSSTAGVTVKCL